MPNRTRAFRLILAIWSLALLVPCVRAQTASPFVSGVWSGNVTTTSATVCIRLINTGQRVRLAVSASDQLTSPVFSTAVISAAASGSVVSLDIAGLQPATTYYYGIEVAGVLRTEPTSRGRFRTFPQGAASFKIALIGDMEYRDADQSATDAVTAEQANLLLLNGDLHYSDLSSTLAEDYRVPIDNTLKHPNLGPMFRSTALAYIWDDHDFAGGNDSNGSMAGPAAVAAIRSVFRDYAPHYPLTVGDGTIGQSFTMGRVRVIMTDLRSAKSVQTLPDNANKTMMGAAQKAWFKQELISARDAGFPLIIWVNSVPWIADVDSSEDDWGGYSTERTEIANFLKDNRIKNLILYCGDMHAMAYDDGTHSDYATGGGAPLVVLHAAPLTREANVKGGPYTAGPFVNSQQYGLLEITDTGGPAIACRYTGKHVGEGAKLIYQFSASAAGIDGKALVVPTSIGDQALVNISARSRLATPGDTFIVGFVVGGTSPRNFLLRAVGPSLAAFGVTGTLGHPVLTLFRGPTVIASNENWSLGDTARLNAVFDRAGAFHFASPTSPDAAVFISLDPGAYTAQITASDGGTGVFLAEVYEVR